MGNNEKNPIESGLEDLKEIIDKMSDKRDEDIEKMKEKLEEIQKKIETGLEKAKEEAPQPPKTIKEAIKENIETMTDAYSAGMMPTTPGEGPAVGIEEEGASVPKFVDAIAAAPEKIEEETEKIRETIDDAVKTNIGTMTEAYEAGMTPTAPGEAPAVGIPEDEIGEGDKISLQPPEAVKEAVETNIETMTQAYEAGMMPATPGEGPAVGIPEGEISEDEKIDIPTPKELFEISAETMTEAAEVGMNPLEADPGIVLPKEE